MKSLVFVEMVDGVATAHSREVVALGLSLGSVDAVAVSSSGWVVPTAVDVLVARAAEVDVVLVPASIDGVDVGARIAAALGVGVVTDVVGLDASGAATKLIFGGTQQVTVAGGSLSVMTVRPEVESLRNSWLSNFTFDSSDRYSVVNASQITVGLTSVPVSSVMC